MDYRALADVYAELETESATLEKRRILAECFADVDPDLLPEVVRLVRGRVFARWESGDLGVSSSLASDAIAKATGVDGKRIEDWWREEGDLGDAAARAVESRTQQTLFSDPLTVSRVYDTLREVATYEGEGSQGRRVDAIAGLMSDADLGEARYVIRTVVGVMRLGVGEGIVRDALADALLEEAGETSTASDRGGEAAESAVDAVERAYEVTNDFAIVAERAREDGREGLADLDVEVFRPIKPMLAGTAEDLETALADLADDAGEVHLEVKYDGIRAKLHRQKDDIRLFTRRLEDVTEQFPDVVEAVAERVDDRECILEAEIVGYHPETGDPVPFQELSQRIKRKNGIEAMAEEVPVTVYVFDILYLDGESLLNDPLRERLSALEGIVSPSEGRIERAASRRTDSLDVAEAFYEDALAAGHEGLMVKNLDALYQPGSRVGYQQKVKPTMEPLDLVVTRAKWSEGRKSDYLGRPYLACRAEDGTLREVGRMHTGFTDEQLEAFHDLVEPLIESVDGREAQLRPEVVLEVEYEEIQESPKYDSGFALRFPRLKNIRGDLDPEDADSFERVRRLYQQQE